MTPSAYSLARHTASRKCSNSQYGREAPYGATTNAQNRRKRVCRVPVRACFIDGVRQIENCWAGPNKLQAANWLVRQRRVCYKFGVFESFSVSILKTIHTIALGFALFGATSVAAAADEPDLLAEQDDSSDNTEEPAEQYPAPQTAHEVLAGILARLPVEPITLNGQLTVRRQRGLVLREVPFSIRLAWGDIPARAEYRLADTFGRTVEGLTVVLHTNGAPELSWHAAGSAVTNPPPALTDFVQNTDITWMDLSLAFLWWHDARLAGEAPFRGSLCDQVLATPPEPIPGCAAMRLWVDRRLRFLRQVEQIDESGAAVRRMWVSSVGKTGDRWMIRNMEVERPGSLQRTKIHIDDLDTP